MRQNLTDRSCQPCLGGVPPLRGEKLKELAEELGGDWQIMDEHHLLKSYKFKNFKDALAFVDRVGSVAEEQNHHPDIRFGWGYAEISIWTHKIDGLTESDFILAAKIDAMTKG